MIIFLYKSLILVSLFDGIRSNSIFSELSFIKEFIFFILLSISTLNSYKYKTYNRIFNILPKTYFLLLAYLLVWGFIVTFFTRNEVLEYGFHDSPAPFTVFFKTIESLLIILLFLMFETNTGKPLKYLIKYSIYIALFFIVINTIGYFIDLSFFLKKNQPWPGRIAIGYPTSDAQILAIILFSSLSFNFNSISRILLTFFLTFGIIIQSTATSLFSLFIILVYYSFKWKNILFITIGLIISYITFIFSSEFITNKFTLEIESFTKLFELKINSLFYEFFSSLNMNQIADSFWEPNIDSSSQARLSQRELTFSTYNSFIYIIFGAGTALCTFVENQYTLMFRAFGLIGLILYIITILTPIILSFKLNKRKRALIILSSTIIFFTNLSLISTYITSLYLFYSLALAYGYEYLPSGAQEK